MRVSADGGGAGWQSGHGRVCVRVGADVARQVSLFKEGLAEFARVHRTQVRA